MSPRAILPILLLVMIIGACAANSTLLNSERISRTFGSYGVDVLQTNGNRRISSLYSTDGATRTARTYAVVDYTTGIHAALAREHALIMAGGSIGATLRRAGWQLDKQHIFIGEFRVPDAYDDIARLMRIELPEMLATHVYLLIASDDQHSYRYATITEIHHPAYLTAKQLHKIYGEMILDDSNRDRIRDFIGTPNDLK